ncbi:MAG: hypothetical protein IIY94_07190, partial [Oscillospiraceae bacterium]|nr:hypothetical protein [Oscillospiraceae bacterium]
EARIWKAIQSEVHDQMNDKATSVSQKPNSGASEPVLLKAKKERPILRWAVIAAACVVLVAAAAAGSKLLRQNGNRGVLQPAASGTEPVIESTIQDSVSTSTTILEVAETSSEETAPQQEEVKSDTYFLEQTENLLNRAGFLGVDSDDFQLSVLPASNGRSWNEVEVCWESKTGPVSLRYEQEKGILLSVSGMNLVATFEDPNDPIQEALDFYASLTPEQGNVEYSYTSEPIYSEDYEKIDSYLIRFSPLPSTDNCNDCIELHLYGSYVGIEENNQVKDDQYFHQRALDILKQAGYTDLEQDIFSVNYYFYDDPYGGLSRDHVEVYFEGRGTVSLDYETGSLLQMPGFKWTVSGNGPCASQEEADALVTQFYESLPVPQGYSIAYCGPDERRPDWLCYGFSQKITAAGLPDDVYGRGFVTILLDPNTGDMEFLMAEDFPIDPIPSDETPLTKAEAWEIIRDSLTPEEYALFEKADLDICSYSPFVLKEMTPQNSSYKVTRLYWTADYDNDVYDSVWVDCYTGEFYHLHE